MESSIRNSTPDLHAQANSVYKDKLLLSCHVVDEFFKIFCSLRKLALESSYIGNSKKPTRCNSSLTTNGEIDLAKSQSTVQTIDDENDVMIVQVHNFKFMNPILYVFFNETRERVSRGRVE